MIPHATFAKMCKIVVYVLSPYGVCASCIDFNTPFDTISVSAPEDSQQERLLSQLNKAMVRAASTLNSRELAQADHLSSGSGRRSKCFWGVCELDVDLFEAKDVNGKF